MQYRRNYEYLKKCCIIVVERYLFMKSVIIGSNQAGQRLDKFLHKYLPNAGSSFLYKMLRKKNITLNGKKAEGKEMLSVGDEVKLFFADETFAKFAGQSVLLVNNEYYRAYQELKGVSVLYEDEQIVILNKPAGILTQKAEAADLSLNEWLVGYLLNKGTISENDLQTFKPSVCNRLDRNTSGIVLCGKSLAGSQALSRIIKERSLQKYYHTVCIGEIKDNKHLKGFLHKDKQTNKVSVVDKLPVNTERKDYSEIETAYNPLRANHAYTLLEVELITGKTHQIRSHLAYIGHSIIGDGKYGNKKTNQIMREKYALTNQLLHAKRVIFPKAEGALKEVSEKEIIAPYPELFQNIVSNLF